MNDAYTMEKPKISLLIWGLILMMIIGLVGLGTATYSAFSLTTPWWQALAFSLIIELGAILEAIAIIRNNKYAIPGLIISLFVSGLYNYTQARNAGLLLNVPLTNPFELAALSIGPLSAVFFMALTLGKEYKKYEEELINWKEGKRLWLIERDNKLEQDKIIKEKEDRERTDRKAKEQLEQQERLEKAKIDAETKIQIAKIKAESKHNSSDLSKKESSESFGKLNSNSNLNRTRLLDWRKLSQEDKDIIAGLNTTWEIKERYNVQDRTALNWFNKSRKIVISNNGNGAIHS